MGMAKGRGRYVRFKSALPDSVVLSMKGGSPVGKLSAHFRTVKSSSTVCVVSLLLLCSLSGCLSQVKRNVEATDKTGAVVGSITTLGRAPDRIIAVALEKADGRLHVHNYTHLNKSGKFILRIERGTDYTIVAFADLNSNLTPEPGEPVGLFDKVVNLSRNQGFVSIELALDSGSRLPEQIESALTSLGSVQRKPLPVTIGEIADLTDPIFSAEYGEKGLWEFFDFVTNAGIGVYFLEPYDPDKTPVLFVNGAGGSPQDWVFFFDHLDRTRYQPWFFFYPSGARLDGSAETLNSIVRRLHGQYGFGNLYVVAHSMGGLVSRGFIKKALIDDRADFIKLFVTISTPWQGHGGARYGVEMAPATVPSWIDMVPGSAYQQELYSAKVGDKIDYFLLFGYRGGSVIFSGNNDGTVALSSMLFQQAQQEARKVYGFEEDHTSILKSKEVFETVSKVFSEAGTK